MSRSIDRSAGRKKRRLERPQDHGPLLRLVDETGRKPTPPSRKPLKPLTASQSRYDNAIGANRVIFATGPAGTGKAQPLDALVKTPDGWLRMGDLVVGSKISAVDGSVTSVTAIYPQGEKDIYKIVFEDGREAECCDEHLWRVYRYDWRPANTQWRVIPLSEIRRLLSTASGANRLYIELPEPEKTPDLTLAIDPYLMGLLLGDGHFGRTDIRISTADACIVNAIQSLLPVGMHVHHRKNYDYDLVRDSVLGSNANPLMTAVRDLGLYQIRCDEKFVPESYKLASASQKLALLQGLMDADGTVCHTGSTSFSTVSRRLALDVQEIVRSLGGLASITEKNSSFTYLGEKRAGKLAYRVHIRVKCPRDLFRLARKRNKLSETYQYADSLKLRIKSVSLVGRKQAQCIAVEHESRLYITNDFVVTHNTWWAAARAAEQLLERKIERIVVTRPAVEAGEQLGFLPGELEEKYEPYFRPVRDALEERLGSGHLEYLIKSGAIEARPLAYLRGATLKNAWVILDEAQNTTPTQMKMFLTRIGEGSKFIVNGDLNQTDIPGVSGLQDAVRRLRGVENIGFVNFSINDIVRDPMCHAIALRYEKDRLSD